MAASTGGLKRTSSSLGTAIADLVTKGPMDPAKLDEIEDALIRADLGDDLAASRHQGDQRGPLQPGHHARRGEGGGRRRGRRKSSQPVAKPLVIGDAKPFVILVVGVNGSGKTTTIGKLAAKFAPKAARWCSPPATPSAPPPSTS